MVRNRFPDSALNDFATDPSSRKAWLSPKRGQQRVDRGLKFFLLTMKANRLLLISVTAALPILAVMAEDTGKTETANQQTASDVQNKPGAGKDQMLCKSDCAGTDLDKLVADMNSATSDKKVDAIAAVVAKLAEEFKTAQQKTETKTANTDKSEMGMCKMMMGMNLKDSEDNHEGDHEHHH
jgi:hypothetical protein